MNYIREAAKKSFLSGRATKRRGGGLTGLPLRKKELFYVRKTVPMVTKPGGRGLKALVAGPLRKDFFPASLGVETGVSIHIYVRVFKKKIASYLDNIGY